MNIGLYFGSFNPVHSGHLIIASYLADNTNLDEIWIMVSPQNPLKRAPGLLNENHRYSLVQLAVEGESKLKASNAEFKLPRPTYTIDTLVYLDEKYPHHYFSVIMGSDSFRNIERWKNYKQILNGYNIYIYIRPGYPVDPPQGNNINILNAPLLDISATFIRKNIREKKSIRYLVPENVKEEIERMNFYGSALENPPEQ